MKTIFVNCSPKKKMSVSGYLNTLAALGIKGEKVKEQVRNKGDHERVLSQIKEAEAVVFSMPLFVDSVPSHIMNFLADMEAFCLEKGLAPKVYVIANNGFIEGRQNKALMQVMQNFCKRSHLPFGGGIAVGGGVMLNVTRILFPIQCGLVVFSSLMNGLQTGNFMLREALLAFIELALVMTVLHCGVLFFGARLIKAINRRGECSVGYTRMMLPSFLFALVADIFFIIISIFGGGIFKGWLARKTEEQ
ncbi:MAG: hypothetical protein IKW00_08350 [Clostridia bacterium]|nr:hypothetical protein [Clostridia bacterium]